MPARISIAAASGAFNLRSLSQVLPEQSERFARCSSCVSQHAFSTTAHMESKKSGRKKINRRIDPYRVAQAQQRKTANLEKRRQLQVERAAAMGDPVRSKPTPFLSSLNLDNANASQARVPNQAISPGAKQDIGTAEYLNYFLTPQAAVKQLDHSKWLTEPLFKVSAPSNPYARPSDPNNPDPADVELHKERVARHAEEDTNAREAILHITSLGNANAGDKTRINVQRCIETFGRHNTDGSLPPKPASVGQSRSTSSIGAAGKIKPVSAEEEERQKIAAELAQIPKRVGPDTGSSEVQIAILTTKINALADNLNKKDKNNKNNLRLLVHRRQKLLAYLRRKERGGPRWQNLVEMLGINDAMWKGEISL